MTLTTRKRCLLSTLALLLLTFFSTVSAHEQSSAHYTMPKDVLSNGGDKAISSNYQMVATAGQYATGEVQSNGMVLQTGFHQRRGVRDEKQCPNTTCYVTTNGNDETGDGSEANPFATIQHGINVAKENYTVLVHSGTYVENINFNGKNIIVKSTDGAEKTVIDGNNKDTVLLFRNGEKTTVDGFTITHGLNTSNHDAGGIGAFGNSAPILKNIIVTDDVIMMVVVSVVIQPILL